MQDEPNFFPQPGQIVDDEGRLLAPNYGFPGPPSVVMAMLQAVQVERMNAERAQMERVNAERAQMQIFLLLLLSQT